MTFSITFSLAKVGTLPVIFYLKSIEFAYEIKIVAVFETYLY